MRDEITHGDGSRSPGHRGVFSGEHQTPIFSSKHQITLLLVCSSSLRIGGSRAPGDHGVFSGEHQTSVFSSEHQTHVFSDDQIVQFGAGFMVGPASMMEDDCDGVSLGLGLWFWYKEKCVDGKCLICDEVSSEISDLLKMFVL